MKRLTLVFLALISVRAYGAASETKTIVFIGDSISAGYGVRAEEAFPARIEALLLGQGKKVHVVNAGISGSVSAGADGRVKYYLKLHPDLIVLELGGNDALQGMPTENLKTNLAKAIDIAQAAHVKLLLIGMRVFSNFGEKYASQFSKVYADLSKEKHVPLMPFLLQAVALKPELNQSDMIHPNAKGHELVAHDVLPYVEALL